MAQRPGLTEDTFLKFLFSPAKNPLPTGIRKRKLVGTKGRNKGRLAAYNRMTGANQELLRRSGLREQYLTGEANLSDARQSLRNTAVRRGLAKPLRQPTPSPTRNLDDIVAGYVYRTLTGDKRPKVNYNNIRRNITHLPTNVKPAVTNWTAGKIKAYGADNTNIVTNSQGKDVNPLWYH